MAAAEARAVWQRTANRCFVQEDAKRAPKLACCPPAAPSAKQVDNEPVNAEDGKDNFTPGFSPHNSHVYPNLSPDSRWWLQSQPNHACQRGLDTFLASEVSGVQRVIFDPSAGFHSIGAESKTMNEELKFEGGDESYEFLEMDSTSSKGANEIISLDSGFSWTGSDKSGPWWRTTYADELASLVAQKSHDFVENCDLPQPRNTSFKRDRYAQDGIFTSSKEWKPHIVGCRNPTVHTKCNAISGSAQSIAVHPQSVFGKRMSDGSSPKDFSKTAIPEIDSSRAQLLEALRHSQTRAREAEKAAKEAQAEKEHIVHLFFKQASHLFAYKQWFQLLQLENLYVQLTNNSSQPISSLFPIGLPWMHHKTERARKNRRKRAKHNVPNQECDISKYAVLFALGLSLVGAGLLLGWTVGWMFPAL